VTVRNGKENLQAWVNQDIAARFRTLARREEGGVSAYLARMVTEAVGEVHATTHLAGMGEQIHFRLYGEELSALLAAAKTRGTTPTNWARSLLIVHLLRKPQWNAAEVRALTDLARLVRPVAVNLNQIARALNVAVKTGEYPAYQGEAAKEGTEVIRYEMRRLAAVLTGNFEYWGLPDQEKPRTSPEEKKRMKLREKARIRRKRKGRVTTKYVRD
jgi:hypothetical protein